MTFEDQYKRFSERFVHLETILLLIMFVSSAYMLWGTFGFQSASAARFPRLTAGTVLVGSALLLSRNYLPDRVAAVLTEQPEVFETDEELEQNLDQSTSEQTAPASEATDLSVVGRPIPDSLFTAIAIVGYGVLGFAIGIYLATPIFVFAYARWFKLSWKMTIALTVLAVAIGDVFMGLLGVPLDRGEILFPTGVLNVSGLPLVGILA
ncbi:tripartite tricarboxylate transporter TctB family protein [Halalkalicoccus sp. NIPERK01]|uniref:tripartite tricarboxylate transporter TctB family protein n=1 Tax=Halalkalicoccus sp. NIPERK01 TaxID=3053469 RepID=UPI00256F4836|nr:tripartite tricarboxylate transporter TctB family protein [Halalkalicoccus sp. NIPERK01]MDL5363450.1 tripartite tricarboxylate transporter TctB family protein [Halalkalicoccus sp. NIPERK01]